MQTANNLAWNSSDCFESFSPLNNWGSNNDSQLSDEIQATNNPTSPETALEVEDDTPEASPLYNPLYNPSHSAPALGKSSGSAVSVGVPAGGEKKHGVQEMIVANSNSTVAEIRDKVLFPAGVPPPHHSLTFERQQNASDNLPVQPPSSYEATVREILL